MGWDRDDDDRDDDKDDDRDDDCDKDRHGRHGDRHHHRDDDDDCDRHGRDDDKDDDGANNGGNPGGGTGGTPGGASGVTIPADTSGITFHVDETDDGNVNAYMYIQAEDGVDPATVSFDDYLVQLKAQLAESHPDLDPSTAVIKATIYSPSEGESYYYFDGTEFQAVEDAQYYEEFAGNFGTIPDDDPPAEEDDEDEDDIDC